MVFIQGFQYYNVLNLQDALNFAGMATLEVSIQAVRAA